MLVFHINDSYTALSQYNARYTPYFTKKMKTPLSNKESSVAVIYDRNSSIQKDPAIAGGRFISASVLTHVVVLLSPAEDAVPYYLVAN